MPERFLNPDAPPPSPPLAKTPKAEGGDGKVTTEAGEKKDAETEDAKKESSVPAGGSIGATNLPTTASKDAAASGPTSNTPPNPISTATNESKVEKVEKVETAQAQGSLTT